MTSEEEKQLALLCAVTHLGGHGSKQQVLDEVEKLGLMKLSAADLAQMESRNEVKWRNNLAYVRKHLVTGGYFAADDWDDWRITNSGTKRYASLVEQAVKQHQLQHVSRDAILSLVSTTQAKLSNENALSKETGTEGTASKRWTTIYERKANLRAAAIELHGTVCMGCGFDFKKRYGSIGEGFIEVHHLNPVSSMGGSATVDPKSDLVVLCSNCHSIVHRRQPEPLSIAELKASIQAAESI